MQTGAERMAAALEQRVAACADALAVAREAHELWRAVHAALSPIIGAHGVAALARRSLHLTRGAHPALNRVDLGDEPIDFARLRDALAHASRPDARAAHAALFRSFYGLLSSLIGDALTERLLRSTLDPHPTARPPQEPTP